MGEPYHGLIMNRPVFTDHRLPIRRSTPDAASSRDIIDCDFYRYAVSIEGLST